MISFFYSGDVFVGRMLKKHHPYRLSMLGHYIFTSVIEDLKRLYKIDDKKTKVCDDFVIFNPLSEKTNFGLWSRVAPSYSL